MNSFSVDTDELVKFTNRLERLNTKAMPNAVRNTLNSLAFDMKKKTIQISALSNFEKRQPNFFRVFSRVEMARGNDIRLMQSEVGFRDPGGSNYAVKDLEQQESGGKIGHKAFIPLDQSRVGKSNKKVVQKRFRVGTIKNVVHTNGAKGVNRGQRFIKSAIHAGIGGHVLTERGILYRVESLTPGRRKMIPIYSVKGGRSVTVKATHFMQEATNMTTKRTGLFFKYNAKREFDRVLG